MRQEANKFWCLKSEKLNFRSRAKVRKGKEFTNVRLDVEASLINDVRPAFGIPVHFFSLHVAMYSSLA